MFRNCLKSVRACASRVLSKSGKSRDHMVSNSIITDRAGKTMYCLGVVNNGT